MYVITDELFGKLCRVLDDWDFANTLKQLKDESRHIDIKDFEALSNAVDWYKNTQEKAEAVS